MSPALAGGFLTTAPPGMSLSILLLLTLYWLTFVLLLISAVNITTNSPNKHLLIVIDYCFVTVISPESL